MIKASLTTDVPNPNRVLRRFKSFAEQEEATFSYWQGKSIAERMAATADLARSGYLLRGIDIDAQGSNRSLVRVQRSRG